jgi:beta-glucanase (GH16 family)
MLGSDYPHVGWPECGEIDIMESFGSLGKNNQISASVHTTTDNFTAAYTFPTGETAAGVHTYAVNWRPGSLQFSVDGNVFETVMQSQAKTWPFQKPFFLILNNAIGGTMGGAVPATQVFPYVMDIQSVTVTNSKVTS